MQQNTTDAIAKMAFNTTKERWKEFMLLPVGVTIGVFLLVGLLFSASSTMGTAIFGLLLYIALMVFMVVFMTAEAKWCSDIYAGRKVLDVKAGLLYGLSRFWGVIGTTLLTILKVMLWTLLLVIPGYYKGIMYSMSVKISQMDGISGGDANRLSQLLVSKSGILRTLGNMMAISFVSVLLLYLYWAVAFLIGFLFMQGNEILGMAVMGILCSAGMIVMMTFLVVFKNYQYLIFKDENKAEFASLAKTLKSMA